MTPPYAVVYQARNLINGKRYIGVTSRSIQIRKSEHVRNALAGRGQGNFARAIRKYGADAFRFSLLLRCASKIEAVSEEIRLIALLRPEYNSTMGGDGQLGRPMSTAGRLRLSEFHKGRQWRLGTTHTPEARQKMRVASRRRTEEWRSYAVLGPEAMARPVICHDDKKIFPSASAASREYGVAKSALIELCLNQRGRKTVNGLRFSYLDRN